MANWMRITGYVLHRKDLYDYVRLEDIDSYNEATEEWNGSRLFRRMGHPIICVRC